MGKGKSKDLQRKQKIRLKKLNKRVYASSLLNAIRKWDDPILKEECSKVTEEDDRSFITRMKKTLLATKDGVGIAASQIGVKKSVFVFRQDIEAQYVRVVINPSVVETGNNEVTRKEGCLSFPGIYTEVKRPSWIKLKFEDEYGKVKTEKFTGNMATVVQHELDHTLGICRVGDAWESKKKEEQPVVAQAESVE